MTHVNPVIDQLKFRAREDSGNEATPTWIDNVNTNWSQAVDADFRVRFEVGETAGASNAEAIEPTLMYSLNAGTWTLVTASSPIQFGTFTGATDGDATTQQLGTASFVAGSLDDNGTMSTTGGLSNQSTEFEWCLTIDSAQVANTDTIGLRVYHKSSVLDAYTNEPTITVVEVTNTNVTLDAGSYTITGQTLDAKTNTNAALAAGSYALTGQTLAVNVALNTPVALAAGTYTVTGFDLAIPTNANVGLAAGSYAVSGFDLTASVASNVPLAAGSYTLSGLALTETINRSVALAAGSYGLTGQTLTVDLGVTDTPVALDAGSYTLSGLALAVPLNTNAALVAGTYALTGLAVDVPLARNSVLGAGSYTLTGQPLATFLNTNVALNAGSYALTGFALSGAVNVSLSTGSYTITGQTVTVDTGVANTNVGLDAGSYTLTGLDVDASVTTTPTVSLGGGTPRQRGNVDRIDDDDEQIIARIQRMLDAEKQRKPLKTKAARAKRKKKVQRVELDLALFRKATPEVVTERLEELKQSVAALDAKLAREMRAIDDAALINLVIQAYYDRLAILLLLAA